jgi:hypothetical protein
MPKAKKEKAKNKKEGVAVAGERPAFLPYAPKIEDSVSVSKDGKWIISRVTITSIKPRRYFEKVLGVDEPEAQGCDIPPDADSAA